MAPPGAPGRHPIDPQIAAMSIDPPPAPAAAPPRAATRTTVFCLHCLGGSARLFDALAARLSGTLDLRGIDLPGFGEAARLGPADTHRMADHAAEAIAREGGGRFLLCGHSMGAKIALVLARRAEDGDPGLSGLAGLLLLSGSPPSPEPLEEQLRAEMLDWFVGTEAERRDQADLFVERNRGRALSDAMRAMAAGEVLRADPSAWRAWLDTGARQDLAAEIGVLRTPALVLSGANDEELGPDGQIALMAPHLAACRIECLEEAGHLLPIEATEDVAVRIEAFLAAPPAAVPTGPEIDPAWRALLLSDRVGSRIRAALLERAEPDDPAYRPRTLNPPGLAVLRALADRILPQPHVPPIDLAARLDRDLSDGPGDGWRFEALPPDAAAACAGVAAIDRIAHERHGRPFLALDDDAKDALIGDSIDGRVEDDEAAPFGTERLGMWLEDLRAGLTRIYLDHPATMARLGLGGIAYGGDGPAKSGFPLLAAGERADWEPVVPIGRPA